MTLAVYICKKHNNKIKSPVSQLIKKHHDKNSPVFNHTCLYRCRIVDVKPKNKRQAAKEIKTSVTSIYDNTTILPVRILVNSYMCYASILVYIKQQRNKRATRRLSMSGMRDAHEYTQA